MERSSEGLPYVMHLKGTPSVGDVLGNKAINYIAYAPNIDVNQAYAWLKESLETEKGGSKGPILHYFLDMSLNKLKADPNHKEQFIQDYLTDSEYADACRVFMVLKLKRTNQTLLT